MPAYLKIEELQDDSNQPANTNSMESFMDLSLLALFIAPLALLGLGLHALNVSIVTQDMLIASNAVLVMALPQVLRWIRS